MMKDKNKKILDVLKVVFELRSNNYVTLTAQFIDPDKNDSGGLMLMVYNHHLPNLKELPQQPEYSHRHDDVWSYDDSIFSGILVAGIPGNGRIGKVRYPEVNREHFDFFMDKIIPHYIEDGYSIDVIALSRGEGKDREGLVSISPNASPSVWIKDSVANRSDIIACCKKVNLDYSP